MTHHKIYEGDVRECLRKIQDESVNMCVTSPPYYGLRDYKTAPLIWDGESGCEHEWDKEIIRKQSGGTDKASVGNNIDGRIHYENKSNFCSKCNAWKGSLGLEPQFDLYIKHLCDIFDGVKRVLRKDGSCWVNIGDSYSGSWGDSGHRPERSGISGHQRRKNTEFYDRKGHPQFNPPTSQKQVAPPKSLCLIPFRFAIEMVNRGWILRNTIIWHKSNCMPSSASDRFTVDFEYLFFFSKNKKYYFERQFDGYTKPLDRWGGDSLKTNGKDTWDKGTGQSSYRDRNMRPNECGRNKRAVWNINTKPFAEAHFAVFPEELIETPIKAGCPEFICNKCGKPREKIMDMSEKINNQWGERQSNPQEFRDKRKMPQKVIKGVNPKFKGYTDCGCNAGFHPGTVLDPFAGSGTTGKESKNQGKNSILIELNPEYIPMIIKRLDLGSQDVWKESGVELEHTYEIIKS